MKTSPTEAPNRDGIGQIGDFGRSVSATVRRIPPKICVHRLDRRRGQSALVKRHCSVVNSVRPLKVCLYHTLKL